MKVLITGGSGLVGMKLTKLLIENNIDVAHLTRTPNSKAGIKTYKWDYEKGYLDENALNDVTHIVHLAGAGIADKPWTMNRKRLIVKSRVLTARLLRNECSARNTKLQAFISASGIGYYGATTSEKKFSENDERGVDFVAECCVQWEREADSFSDLCRVVKLRTGIVLSSEGGALEKIGSALKRGIGAPLGTGNQFMPWIHEDDLANIYYQSIVDTNWSGVYNAVAPQDTTNKELTYALAKAMNKKIWLPNVPKFMLKLIFSEMANILLEGSKVDATKVVNQPFEFKHKEIGEALNSLFKKP